MSTAINWQVASGRATQARRATTRRRLSFRRRR
jgi:hypothetical protein